MLLLPLTGDPARSFTTDFAEGKYLLEARWNERGAVWTFDVVRDADQVRLLAGVPILLGQDLLAPYALGIGGLIAADQSQTDTDAGPEDLGERVVLFYLDQAELSIMHKHGVPGIAVRPGDPGTPEFTSGEAPGTASEVNALVDLEEKIDPTGVEYVVMEFDVDLSEIASPTVRFAAAFLGFTEAGTNTIRAYLGGSGGLPDGVLMATAEVIWNEYRPYSIAGSAANPGGESIVKISMESSAADVEAKIKQFSGKLR